MGYPKNKKTLHTFLWDADGYANSSALTGVIPIFSAPANCLIHFVKAQVITAVTGSTAEEVGDGTDADGFVIDNFASLAGIYPLSSNDATCGVFQSAPGATDALDATPELKFYSSADTIDYKITGTATAGKILFLVEFTNL